MATEILPRALPDTKQAGYRLSEQDRLAILSQTPAARLSRRIERERLEFTQRHGDPFGLITPEPL